MNVVPLPVPKLFDGADEANEAARRAIEERPTYWSKTISRLDGGFWVARHSTAKGAEWEFLCEDGEWRSRALLRKSKTTLAELMNLPAER